jgi:DMSO/TMAO reductase YedYZ molybdopterin-dependent catalytic subunit
MNRTVTTVTSTGTRRSFLSYVCRLGGAALLGAVGAGRATLAAQLSKDRLIIRSPRPEDLETPPHLLTAWITPNDLFYVRSHFYTPVVREAEWKLLIDGDVDRPFETTLAELRSLAPTRQVVTLECAGNGRAFFDPRVAGVQWEKGAVGTAEWRGVRLADLGRRGAHVVVFTTSPGKHEDALRTRVLDRYGISQKVSSAVWLAVGRATGKVDPVIVSGPTMSASTKYAVTLTVAV